MAKRIVSLVLLIAYASSIWISIANGYDGFRGKGTGGGLRVAPATSAPGLGLAPAASAPGRGSSFNATSAPEPRALSHGSRKTPLLRLSLPPNPSQRETRLPLSELKAQ
jgi:hypothetical protein